MGYCTRLNRKLYKLYHGQVNACEKNGCLVLTGELDDWQEIVRAGRVCVNKKKYLGLVNDIHYMGGPIPPMRVPALRDDALNGASPDVLVVGGGIVG